jgi:predicted nucleic acid-binding protein
LNALCFLDTNILLYSISTEPAESDKREKAIELLDRGDCALSVQVLQEFYVQATRVTRPDALAHETAVGLMHSWCRFPVQDVNLSVLAGALAIKAAHGFSYWDSAIIAAAREIGCRTLYSEDLTHGQIVEKTRIINPFL